MKITLRRKLLTIIAVPTLLALSACMFLPDFAGQQKAGKYDPVIEDPHPHATAIIPAPETQTEPHTCGLHAMRSLYVGYGMDPDDFNLRFRLGTDQPAMRLDKDSTGTLHPDLYRVLAQDGFNVKPLVSDPKNGYDASQLESHLAADQLALAVVYRSTYHWVLLGPSDTPGRLIVVDSLQNGAVEVNIDTFINEALSITCIEPALPGTDVSTTDAHAAGLAEMARLYQRK